MRGFDAVKGHGRAKRVLLTALKTGRIAHAYLFWGVEGIGKHLMALALAEILLCKDENALANGAPCGTCDSCRKTAAGTHPDLHLLEPGEKAISVEEARNLERNLAFQAYEKGRKVAIIRDSFNMTREAANALLKTVEEPPRGTYLVLTATHVSSILPTLASRCRQVRFDPLASATVEGILVERGIEPGRAARLAELSAGSPGQALAMERVSGADLEEEAERIASGLVRMGVAERLGLSEKWSKDKDNLETRFACLERALRMRSAADDGAPALFDRLNAVRDLISRNVNPQLALDALFLLDARRRLEEMN